MKKLLLLFLISCLLLCSCNIADGDDTTTTTIETTGTGSGLEEPKKVYVGGYDGVGRDKLKDDLAGELNQSVDVPIDSLPANIERKKSFTFEGKTYEIELYSAHFGLCDDVLSLFYRSGYEYFFIFDGNTGKLLSATDICHNYILQTEDDFLNKIAEIIGDDFRLKDNYVYNCRSRIKKIDPETGNCEIVYCDGFYLPRENEICDTYQFIFQRTIDGVLLSDQLTFSFYTREGETRYFFAMTDAGYPNEAYDVRKGKDPNLILLEFLQERGLDIRPHIELEWLYIRNQRVYSYISTDHGVFYIDWFAV